MTRPAIRFEGVSKRFTIHHERYRSFQELAGAKDHLRRVHPDGVFGKSALLVRREATTS